MGMKWVPRSGAAIVLALSLLLLGFAAEVSNGGITSSFLRKYDLSKDMTLDSDVFKAPPGYNAPQQVHITQGDMEGKGVIVSWITPDEPGSNIVLYWAEGNAKQKSQSEGTVLQYKYTNYTSGYIHHCTIKGLEFETKYYYEVGIGSKSKRQFWFTTPPKPGPDVPYTFGLIGDLGQTYDSNTTVDHYMSNSMNPQTLLFVGDLSYADAYPLGDNSRWDTWGRFTEKLVAYKPAIWSAGNHDIQVLPENGENEPFQPYIKRYPTPYKESGSSSPLWYSVKRASAYIIVLSSYSASGKYTPQYKWLENEFTKVNRTETPWLVVVMHVTFYTGYDVHFMEGETMRVVYEKWFVENKVDVVFAGHVHAYERSERVSNIKYKVTNGICNPIKDESAPVYITIGDGGNLEGLATGIIDPLPEYSAFIEPSFGHAIFDIKNRTHAYFGWHRNQDGYAVEADTMWLHNRYWKS
ncbi:unnamed protein product [Linum trigynum]|uniref:Purple acid phosphatase n=1 Tax=Linum trigynum TaxID=586398 RepID=A0AAV2EEW9_9ROSI